MKTFKYHYATGFCLIILLFSGLPGCQKQDDWLNIKRNKTDISPQNLDELQAVLDNTNTINTSFPMLALTGTDNLYIDKVSFGSVSQYERNAYRWAKDLFETGPFSDFGAPYIIIAYANIVLEGLLDIEAAKSDKVQFDNIKGQALFHRAMALYNLSQVFCKPYIPADAAADPGLLLKTSSDPNVTEGRSSVRQTYNFIISDLNQAVTLLSDKPVYNTRPGLKAAYSLLAKVYLAMQDYNQAGWFAQLAATSNSKLLDFNGIDPGADFVFPPYSNDNSNPEIIFFAFGQGYTSLWPVYNVSFVDSLLYGSYDKNDLRKTLFFKENSAGKPRFTGSYSGTYYNFSGIALNEILLIQSESLARLGQTQKALDILNKLLVKRYKTGAYKPIQTTSAKTALQVILNERRKELPFTGQLRWEDLRRLNQDPVFAKTLVHYVDKERIELLPNDKRYVFPIPDLEIKLSGIDQNPR
jgi:hypothetical protein